MRAFPKMSNYSFKICLNLSRYAFSVRTGGLYSNIALIVFNRIKSVNGELSSSIPLFADAPYLVKQTHLKVCCSSHKQE